MGDQDTLNAAISDVPVDGAAGSQEPAPPAEPVAPPSGDIAPPPAEGVPAAPGGTAPAAPPQPITREDVQGMMHSVVSDLQRKHAQEIEDLRFQLSRAQQQPTPTQQPEEHKGFFKDRKEMEQWEPQDWADRFQQMEAHYEQKFEELRNEHRTYQESAETKEQSAKLLSAVGQQIKGVVTQLPYFKNEDGTVNKGRVQYLQQIIAGRVSILQKKYGDDVHMVYRNLNIPQLAKMINDDHTPAAPAPPGQIPAPAPAPARPSAGAAAAIPRSPEPSGFGEADSMFRKHMETLRKG